VLAISILLFHFAVKSDRLLAAPVASRWSGCRVAFEHQPFALVDADEMLHPASERLPLEPMPDAVIHPAQAAPAPRFECSANIGRRN
jgi:hypothetical protein